MSVTFFSDEKEPINRRLPSDYEHKLISFDINYEVDKCVEWILRNNFSNIALHFPDDLLNLATNVAIKIQERTQKIIFILGDTSYASCCVDEIAAEHGSADAIIHFGHTCLSPTKRVPVLYIFGMWSLDVENVTCEFRKLLPDITTPVVIYYEVFYSHAVGEIAESLKEYENLIISELVIPYTECTAKVNDNHVKITKCQRNIIIPKTQDLNDYCIFYIGSQNQTLTNVMLSLNKCKFYRYDPSKNIAQFETLDVNTYLKRRYYYIEKAKDAKIIGILVGTLGVSDYLTVIKHLRELIKAAGKKSYTLVVGKVNIAKLANFAEIEIFVTVACMESSIVDCYGFYQPVITPFELEVALTQTREWTGDYITDFSELLPGAAKHISPSDVKRLDGDVSLITGRLRTSELSNLSAEETENGSLPVVKRDSLTLSTLHSQAAGEYLSARSWKGLEQHLGETPVTIIQEGRKGIACKYDDEEK